MRNYTRSTLFVCLSCMALLVTFGMSCAMRAVPKKQGKVYSKSKIVAKQAKHSDYDLLLEKYKRNIDGIVEQRNRESARLYRESQQALRSQQDNKALKAEAESECLEKLRNMGQRLHGRKLLTSGASPYLIESIKPTSDSSARVFGQLLREDLVQPSVLMSMLYRHADSLSPCWIDNVKYLEEKSGLDSKDQQWAALILHKAGIEKDKCRRVLERAVQQHDNVMALEGLYFETDKETGINKPVMSDENTSLMNKLLKTSSSFDIKVTCADYAAEIGNKTLAEDLCCELLSTRYKALSKPPSNERPLDEDLALGRAKKIAMYVLFYKVKSEKGFKQIYDLSRLPQTEQENIDKMPKGWITCMAYAACELDIDGARSLIQVVRSYRS